MNNASEDKTPSSSNNRRLATLNFIAMLIALAMGAFSLSQAYNLGLAAILLFLAVLFLANGLHLLKHNTNQVTILALEEKLNAKETLLKEVHHRVKNNLQTVSSLLSLQSRSINDEKISSIIKSSQNRVVSMAMVHEMLYKRDDYTSKIELKPYVEELCEYLIRSVKGNANKITTKLDIGDFKLSIDTVIPLGLIINETVTNALKYGIPDNVAGEITINLSKKGANTYEMYLGDNGIGFPEDVNPKTSNSLGLKLIHNLARQLRGTIARDTESKGTYYQITFEEIVEEFNSVD
ncbi:MAG: sensor histidine kinase [Croceitalea sp.]|nr:sensor histidine kinase [Croceitalea sp.]NNC33426.1 sensor histidine kinase [Croceitalea sp.]NNL08036.1 sensor histidine kinase [Croceitalea sp.]